MNSNAMKMIWQEKCILLNIICVNMSINMGVATAVLGGALVPQIIS